MKKRINGQQLGQHVGEEVILLGTINRVNANGNGLELKTTDGNTINASLTEPVNQNLDGYIELHGTLQSKGTIACSHFVHFPTEMLEDFDPDQYNETLTILSLLGDNKWQMSTTDAPL